jgi:hypothetical protein
MNVNAKPTLAEALRQAYEEPGACPPPEAYLAEELAILAPEERARLERHAESCPACSAERDLARTFERSDALSASESRDVARIARRLERRAPGRPRGLAGLLRFPALGGFSKAPAFRMAAAAVLVLVIGVAVQTTRSGQPGLPDAPTDSVVRGGEIGVVSPLGDLDELPGELVWEAVAGAVGYRVKLQTVDDTVLWESAVNAPSAELPEEVLSKLHRAVSYGWSVEALDAEGRTLAASASASFRARP